MNEDFTVNNEDVSIRPMNGIEPAVAASIRALVEDGLNDKSQIVVVVVTPRGDDAEVRIEGSMNPITVAGFAVPGLMRIVEAAAGARDTMEIGGTSS